MTSSRTELKFLRNFSNEELVSRWCDAVRATLQETMLRLADLGRQTTVADQAGAARRGSVSLTPAANLDAEFRRRQSLRGKRKAEKDRREDDEVVSQIVPQMREILKKNPTLGNKRVAELIYDGIGPKKRNKTISVSSLRQKFVPRARKRI